MLKIPKSVLISRIDSVGDVVLSLPVAGMLKKKFPGIKIGLLAAQYTKAIADSCEHIDEFIDIDHFFKNEVLINGFPPDAILHLVTNPLVANRAKELKIPLRIGTMSRLHHWFNCNKLIWLSRRSSGMHEARSNLKILKPFGINKAFSFNEISLLYGLTRLEVLSEEFRNLLDKNKFNIILHPKSRGNAREWPAGHFIELINSLEPERYKVFLSGVESEKKDLQQIEDAVINPVINLAGRISLAQFIPFIAAADGLVSNSTGPLHIAAALGKNTLGIYSSLTHMNPVRWAPIGIKAKAFVLKEDCKDCINTKNYCACINAILPGQIKSALDILAEEK